MNNMFGGRPPVAMGQNTFLPRQQAAPQAGWGDAGGNSFLNWFGRQNQQPAARPYATMGQNTFLGAFGQPRAPMQAPAQSSPQAPNPTAMILRSLMRR